jgi:hypothetical protein
MADSRGSGSKRDRRPSSDNGRPTRPGESLSFRERLQKDRILFAMCLGFLAFTTWALAVSWMLLSEPSLLILALVSLAPAFYLFYLRDAVKA